MERDLEGILKAHLLRRTSGALQGKTQDCPSELELSDYLEGRLSKEEKSSIESHLSDCPYCLDLLVVAKDVAARTNKSYIKAIKILKHKWLIAATISFILSFFFPRYFLQFLIATLILGGKWVFEGQNIKSLVMIFKSLREREKETITSRKNF